MTPTHMNRRGKSPYSEPPAKSQKPALSYSDFIAIVKHLWKKIHPEIPIVPNSGKNRATYPSIVYRLENRQPYETEPKPRPRPGIAGQSGILITGQRFTNIVTFSAITENEPIEAEAIIDEFEDFMHDMTGVLKELGLQELFYNRRFPERDQERDGEDISTHSVAYNVTTEKIRVQSVALLQEFYIDARTYMDTYGNEPATPNSDPVNITTVVTDTFYTLDD